MLFADSRTTLAVVIVAAVALYGDCWFSLSYLSAGLLFTVLALLVVIDPKVTLTNDESAWLGVIAWGAVSAFLVSPAWLASKTTLASWFGAWLIWVAVSRGTRAGRNMALHLLVAAAALAGVAIVAEFIGSGTPRAAGLISNPNISVALISSILPLVVGRFHRRWSGITVAAVLASPIILTGSRAGLLAIGAVAVVVIPSGPKRRLTLALGAVGLGCAALWRSLLNPESLAWHRSNIWGALIEMIADQPVFGIGAAHLGEAMGPYRLYHANEFGNWGHVIGAAESLPLGVAARVGIPGLLLLLLAVGLWFYRCRTFAFPRSGVVAVIVAVGLFHDFLSEPAALWWWAAVLALVTPRPPCAAATRNGRVWRVVPAVAVAGVAAWALLQPAWARYQWSVGQGSPDSVGRVVRIEPWFSEPMKYRVEELLGIPDWTWDEASEARYWSDRLLQVRAGAAWAWAQRGTLDAKVGGELGAWQATIEEARACFATAIALEPRLPWYPYHHAMLERSLGRLDVARGLAMRSVEVEPNFVRGWLLLARLELDRGDVVAARKARSRALGAIEAGAAGARTGYHFALLEHSPGQLRTLGMELP